MSSHLIRWFLVLTFLLAFAYRSPAPLIYRPGEGWIYVQAGEEAEGGAWSRDRAKDQLSVAEEAFEAGNTGVSLKAAKRVIARWPLSDYAPDAQYLIGRSYESRGRLEHAFDAYQDLVEKHPKTPRYEEALERQFEITNEFLDGRWFRLWGWIPTFPSMERTVKMYTKIIQNGPYSEVGPEAQMRIGEAREKQRDYQMAVQAYVRAADRYYEDKEIASDALYKAALAYEKQAKTAEYDQSVAALAIDTYTDFITLFPDDPRTQEARLQISELRLEQARGAFQIARYYEKKRKIPAALIYYNEVILKNPESEFAGEARRRIEELNAIQSRREGNLQPSSPEA